MRRLEASTLLAFALILGTASSFPGRVAATPAPPSGALHFGTTPTEDELSKFYAIQPDGATLPSGSGTVAQGKELFTKACAMCHGEKLEGIAATGAPALAGGRSTLKAAKPLKTVESYWPYATTLFDYIKRAMPFNAPGSLDDAQVYSLVAFILANDKIVPNDAVMDRTTLPKVVMPNRDGFTPYSGPDHRLYH